MDTGKQEVSSLIKRERRKLGTYPLYKVIADDRFPKTMRLGTRINLNRISSRTIGISFETISPKSHPPSSRFSLKTKHHEPSLAAYHKLERPSGNHMRIIKSTRTNIELLAGAHSDFGSLTVLFNNICGLQVALNKEEGWLWVPPRSGGAIINLGDAMVRFTDGLFKSSTHRAVQPPVEQRGIDRYSVVYFERPNDDVKLMPLMREPGDLGQYHRSKEWIERRVIGGKTAHYKDEQAYEQSRGTESVKE